MSIRFNQFHPSTASSLLCHLSLQAARSKLPLNVLQAQIKGVRLDQNHQESGCKTCSSRQEDKEEGVVRARVGEDLHYDLLLTLKGTRGSMTPLQT